MDVGRNAIPPHEEATLRHREFYRRHLPHWQPGGATLFVTFRLAGSLPRGMAAELRAERKGRQPALALTDDGRERRGLSLDSRLPFERWDTALDRAAQGPRWLAQPRVAAAVSEALHYRHERAYDLVAFCIMPNHVHLVCTPLAREDGTYFPLDRVLQSLKRHTARQANRTLERQGPFWQAESYDHVVRDEEELERVIAYVKTNPVKAGLVPDWVDWPWTFARW